MKIQFSLLQNYILFHIMKTVYLRRKLLYVWQY